MIFLHSYHPQPMVFQIGGISVYWYGLLISVGILLGLFLALFLAKKYRLDKNHLWNLALYFIIFGVIGSRVFYILFYNFKYFWQNPPDILKIWEGGFSIHGAIAGGLLALFFYARRRQISFWLLADILAPAVALGQAVGRWGNYFNQELFGRPTGLPWGISIDLVNRPESYAGFEYFHPVFLYESAWSFLIFGILLIWAIKRFQKPAETRAGQIFLTYLIAYSVGRLFLEFLRIDFQPVFLGLRMGQIISLIIILMASLGIFAVVRNSAKVLKK